jgi:hypothetical protein
MEIIADCDQRTATLVYKKYQCIEFRRKNPNYTRALYISLPHSSSERERERIRKRERERER